MAAENKHTIVLDVMGSDTSELNIITGGVAAARCLENSINLRRNIYAGYLNYEGNWDKLSVIAGLRLEYTDQLMQITNGRGICKRVR